MRAARGNILFLILLAIVLFAALSYAVTSSTRGGGNSAKSEDMQAQVGVLENNALQIKTALQRMETIGGYQMWQIDFNNSSNFANTNTNCTSSACRLFNPAGGGVSGYTLPVKLQADATCTQGVWDGKALFRNVGVKDAGSSYRDLVLLYPGVSKDLCNAVNQKYGVSLTSNDQDNYNVLTLCEPNDYSGPYTSDFPTIPDGCTALGDTDPTIVGKPMFCTAKYPNCYFLYYVLKER